MTSLIALFCMYSTTAWSASGITYHGRIVKSDDQPLESATTRFRIRIKSPNAENCILWEEQQTQNMFDSNGIFSLIIGDSTNLTIGYTRVDSYGWGLERVFSNRSEFTPVLGCAVGNSYLPGAADGRILEVSFKEAPADPVWEDFPATKINLMPMSLNTLQLEGYRATEFLKIDPYTNQTPISNVGVNTLLGLIAGTSAVYVKPADPLGGDLSGTLGAGTVVGIRGRAVGVTVPVTGQILKFNGTTWEPAADDTGGATGDASYAAKGIVRFDTDAATSGITVAAGVARLADTIVAAGPVGSGSLVPVITYDAKGRLTTVSTAAVNDATKLPLAGGTMTGPINMGLQNITNATSIAATNFSGRNLLLNDSDTNIATIRAPVNLATDYALTLPTAAPTNGYVLSTDGTGQLSWIAASTGSVTSVGATAPVLTTGGTTPVISLDTGLLANKVPQVGGTALGANGVVVANGLGTALSSLNCTVNQVIKFDASGFATCGADDAGAANAFVQAGNTFAGAATLGTNDNFDLNFEANNTTRMTIQAATGNVGVGTTVPGSKLEVSGSSNSTNITFHDSSRSISVVNTDNATNNNAQSIALRSANSNGTVNSGVELTAVNRARSVGGITSDFVISTNNNSPTPTERVRVLANGNVGVGTSSPTYKLDSRSNSTNIIASIGHGAGNTGAVVAFSARGTITAPTASQSGDLIGVFGGAGYGATGFPAGTRGYLATYADENWTDLEQGSKVAIGTTPIGSTTSIDRLTVGSNGYVGIGTTTPDSTLHVQPDTGTASGRAAYVRYTSADTEYFDNFNSYLDVTTAADYSARKVASSFTVDNNSAGNQTSNYTSGIEVFASKGGGSAVTLRGVNSQASAGSTVQNVIGIKGNADISAPANVTNAYGSYFDVTQTGGSLTNSYGVYIGAIAGTNKFSLYANDATAPSYFAGNVGIGTTSPGNLLTVRPSSNNTTPFNIENSGGNSIANVNISPGGHGILNVSESNGTTVAILSSINGLTIKSTGAAATTATINKSGNGYFAGNVGIGTESPAAKLDVADTGTTTSAIIVPRAGNFTGTTVNGMIRYNSTSTLFEFYQNGAWVNYTTVSDGRLKTDVEPVVNGLDIVSQLNPVFYNWDRSHPKASSFDDKHEVGFIAQEVEKVLPEVVNKGEDSYRSVEYGKIVSVVVAAVKELYAKVLGHDEKLDAQARQMASKADKSEVAQLKADNDRLKQENAAIKAYLCAKDPKAVICK